MSRGLLTTPTTTPDASRVLTFSGSGTAQVKPDSATISAGVSAIGATARAAQDTASHQMSQLIRHMRSVGVADQDLQTDDVSVSERYDHPGSYEADQSLTITVTDPGHAGVLLGEATAGGADSVSGPSFGLEDQRAGYAEAMRIAVADARAKADAAAAQMHARVHEVTAVHETGDGGYQPQPMIAAGAAESAKAPVAVPTETGTQDVSLTVDVSFSYDR